MNYNQLHGHSQTVIVAQLICIVVALISFWWAYRGFPSKDRRNERVTVIETPKGVIEVCNPGRRVTDKCEDCATNPHCKYKVGLNGQDGQPLDLPVVPQALPSADPGEGL